VKRTAGKSSVKTDGRRVARMEKELQQVVATYLVSGFKTPLPGLVTISHVKMPADLRTAKVYVSVLGSDEDRESVIENLRQRAFEIQNFVSHKLQARYCPKLSFFADETTDHVLKIERILHDLEVERKNKKNE
jgi:ribosome-binding factor A